MPDATDLPSRLVEFAGRLRERDLPADPSRTFDAARSLALVDLADAEAFRAALRINLVASVDDYPTFDAEFDRFWLDLSPGQAVAPAERLPAAPEDRASPGGHRSASDVHRITNKDFATLTGDEAALARRTVAAIAPALVTIRSRRFERAQSGGVDLARSLRSARRTHGEIVRLARRRPQVGRLEVVALCDVSGSMDAYASWMLQFLWALQAKTGNVRTFAFSTRLYDISPALASKRFDDVRAAVAATVPSWSGGTTIGACLGEFNERYRHLATSRTVLLIASDGWERGDVNRMARELERLHRRVRRVIWVNPLKGRDGYEPLAKGMAAALPHIDDFLPANSLGALKRLATTLSESR